MPDAPAALYLDFDSHGEEAWGDFNQIGVPVYDIDGDPETFSPAELANIEQIWRQVAEDFLPFNLNVTTVEPTNLDEHHVLRVAVGGDGAWTGGVNSGISYINLYTTDIPNVVFVFPDALAQGSPKLVGDAVSHEAGHAYGLDHQSTYDENGNLIYEYNPGNLNRAPIMGDSYAAQRGVWWQGPTDVSVDDIQDDMSLIARDDNGFGWREDDVGDTTGTATPLHAADQSISGAGFVGKIDDLDYWSFSTDTGIIMIQVSVPDVHNLDAKVALFDRDGNEVVGWQDPDSSDGVEFLATVASGSYVLAIGSHGDYGDVGQYFLTGTVVLPGSVIDAPTSLQGEADSPAQVSLTWSDNADDETYYILERSTDASPIFEAIALLDANTAHFVDDSVAGGTSYMYRVQAVNELAESQYTDSILVSTPPAAPLAPSGLQSQVISTTQVHLTWADNADNETGYVLERTVDGVTWETIALLEANVTSYSDVGLDQATPYQYRVVAVNGPTLSSYSNLAGATTEVPTAPTSLRAPVVTYHSVQLSWIDQATVETAYVVERSTNGTTWTPLATLQSDATSYTDVNVAPNTAYSYRIQAINGMVASNLVVLSVRTLPLPPKAPTGLTGLAYGSYFSLYWIDNSKDEIRFKVLRSIDGRAWQVIGTPAANVRSFRTARPSRGQTYYFAVVAVGRGGNSTISGALAVRSYTTSVKAVPLAMLGAGLASLRIP